jgi:hypothetical protein
MTYNGVIHAHNQHLRTLRRFLQRHYDVVDVAMLTTMCITCMAGQKQSALTSQQARQAGHRLQVRLQKFYDVYDTVVRYDLTA